MASFLAAASPVTPQLSGLMKGFSSNMSWTPPGPVALTATDYGAFTEAPVKTALAVACAFSSLRITGAVVGAGGATTSTYTVRKNGVDTALTIAVRDDLAAGSTVSVAASVSFAAGDIFTLACDSGAACTARVGWCVG